MPSGLGLDSATRDGGTWEGDGVGTAVSEAAGTDADNLESISPSDVWGPADNDPDNSRLHYTADSELDLGAVSLGGLKGMTGADAAVRIRAAKDYMEDHCIGLTSGSTLVNITETASWTFSCLFRLAPANLRAATDDIAEVRLTGASSNSTRLVQIAVGAAGNPLIRLERMGGATNEQDFTSAAQIDDCLEHRIDVSFADAGGSGGTATVYLDKVSIGTVSTTEIFGSGTVRIGTSGNHYIGQIELWNVALSAADIALFAGSRRDGRERDLEAGINANQGTGTTAADITGNHDMTLGAATWDTMRQAHPDYEVTARPPWQPWRRRNALQCNSGGSGYVRTSASLTNRPIMHVMALMRFNRRRGSALEAVRWGNGSTASTYDFRLQMTASGLLRLNVNRYHATDVETVNSDSAVDDGTWYRVSALIGWGGAMSMSLNGTIQADTDTAPAFSSTGSERFYLHVGGYDYDIAYLAVHSRPYTHAEADEIIKGVTPVFANDPGVELLYHLHEGTGTSIPNALSAAAGTDGDLTITATPDDAQWLVDEVENTVPNLQRIDFSEISGPSCTPNAPAATNVRVKYVLIELYNPGGGTLRLGWVGLYRVLWPAIGDRTGTGAGQPTGIQTLGPDIAWSKTHMGASDGTDPGRAPSFDLSTLTDAEASEAVHYVEQSRAMHSSNGTVREVRPVLIMVDRGESYSRQWREWIDNALIIPELSSTIEVDAHGKWRHGMVIRGRCLPW